MLSLEPNSRNRREATDSLILWSESCIRRECEAYRLPEGPTDTFRYHSGSTSHVAFRATSLGSDAVPASQSLSFASSGDVYRIIKQASGLQPEPSQSLKPPLSRSRAARAEAGSESLTALLLSVKVKPHFDTDLAASIHRSHDPRLPDNPPLLSLRRRDVHSQAHKIKLHSKVCSWRVRCTELGVAFRVMTYRNPLPSFSSGRIS